MSEQDTSPSDAPEPQPVHEPGQPLTDRPIPPSTGAEGGPNGNGDGDQEGGQGGQGGNGQPADVAEHVDQEPDRLAQPVGDEQPPRLAFPVVGIGGSAGGIEAFIEFFGAMPPDSGMAFVVIQHLPPERPSLMVDILSKRTTMTVREVADNLLVEPDHVYVIRPGRTVTIREGRLHLSEPLEKRGHERPVDDFFRSLAAEQRQRAISISMSGMGSNGAAGAQAVKAVGGVCIAQDPDTAKFPHMPRALIEAGLADFILRPADMPDVLLGYARHPYARGERAPESVLRAERRAYNEIVSILRARTRRDFSGYKRPTVMRRIQRRMGLNQLTHLADYARALRQSPAEALALADDLFIHVTGFFRDAPAWEALRTQVIRPLIQSREPDGTVRAWVTACSSGEEAYTLAILLLEEAMAEGKPLDVKVFATDMAERSLNMARSGFYPGGIEGEVPPERLDRFFERQEGGYRIKKEVRERVIFAPQNVLQDPPFSRLDLITCRNLLIYLEPPMQERVLKLMHFGLREGAALFLGTSETVGALTDLYEPIDKKCRIYRRVGPTRHGNVVFPLPAKLHIPIADEGEATAAAAAATTTTDAGVDLAGTGVALPAGLAGLGVPRLSVAHATQRALLDRYTPASVVIDREHRIVYFHGRTERFLTQPPGEPTRDLLELAHDEVRGALRQALGRAVADNVPANARDGWLDTPAGRVRIEVTVAPLDVRVAPGYFLVSFLEHPDPPPPPSTARAKSPGKEDEARDLLETDLRRVREELQSTVEELQTSNEELKASNEEVTSVNEELQSANEELETGKEELQSLNEELVTSNSQLQHKADELEQTSNDLTSLLASTDIAVLFLDTSGRIRRYTPAIGDLLEMRPADLGRPLSDLALKFDDPALLTDAAAVLDKLVPAEREVASHSGRWYLRRILPYRTADRRIDGVVVTFLDISRLKGAERALAQHEDDYRLIFESVQEYGIFTTDMDGQVKTWSPGAQRILGYSAREAVGQNCAMIFTPEDRLAREPEKERATARRTGRAVDERWHVRKDGSRFWASGVMSLLREEAAAGGGAVRGLVKVLRDNTDMKRAQEELQQAKSSAEAGSAAKDDFLAIISHELRTPLSAILLWSKAAKRLLAKDAIDRSELGEAVEAITHSAEAQRRLVEDLLDTLQIQSRRMRLTLRPTDLVETVRAALDAVRPTAEVKGLELIADLPADVGMVQADAARLEQVVWNLLTNAVKFTPAGGRVEVTVRRAGAQAEILVADTGQGIAPEFLPRVFQRFSQAEQGIARGKGGLGLGLTIARELIDMHGGTITAASAGIKKGATFIVRLPLPVVPRTGVRKPRKRKG